MQFDITVIEHDLVLQVQGAHLALQRQAILFAFRPSDLWVGGTEDTAVLSQKGVDGERRFRGAQDRRGPHRPRQCPERQMCSAALPDPGDTAWPVCGRHAGYSEWWQWRILPT